jgi:hypothetical protein
MTEKKITIATATALSAIVRNEGIREMPTESRKWHGLTVSQPGTLRRRYPAYRQGMELYQRGYRARVPEPDIDEHGRRHYPPHGLAEHVDRIAERERMAEEIPWS